MGGVMVVYGPPITHSLPPAVGASRTSQFMISKGPAVAQFESQWGGAYPVPWRPVRCGACNRVVGFMLCVSFRLFY